MTVYSSILSIEGSKLKGENPLPIFRDKNHDKRVPDNGSLPGGLKEGLGYEAGDRFLPYRIQDRYSRNRRKMTLKTIVLENDILKAVFLPDYGGRLYSLKDKRNDREILYKNPVFQPANLAILNAWFSGGIEWNIAQLGHTFTTCSPVHAARLSDENENVFLRIYDYERCKNIFWSIDFHLPMGSDKLLIYVRIVNDNSYKVPMYWWTNIALKETKKTRVFSSTPEVIYIDHLIKGFGAAKLPYLPTMYEVDASYPVNIPFASEYFFQTDKECIAPWEAAAYEDGTIFFERSTDKLRYRKMFCWGNHSGGRRWRDFLSKPGEGDYVEIQAGLAPTQLHGIDMTGSSIWDFTQVIGFGNVNSALSHQESWKAASEYIEEYIDDKLNEKEIYEIHNRLQGYCEMEVKEFLNTGSGWGALESLLRKNILRKDMPKGFCFEASSLSREQYPWMGLLQEGYLEETDINEVPTSYMVQKEWQELLAKSLMQDKNQTWNAFMHYGVMLYENGEEEKAVHAFERSLKLRPSMWAYRNLSEVMKRRGEMGKAIEYFKAAYNMTGSFPDKAFYEEYISLLITTGEFQRSWEVYASMPENIAASDRIKILIGPAALALDKEEFLRELFVTEFAVIREGEVSIVDLWYKYNAGKLAKERNACITDELLAEVKVKFPPPVNIDFRMFID